MLFFLSLSFCAFRGLFLIVNGIFLFRFIFFIEKMAQNIREEITRLHRRKQLNFTYHNVERMQDSESSGSEMGPDSPRRPDTPPNLRNPEKGLFTFKQVSLVIGWMII